MWHLEEEEEKEVVKPGVLGGGLAPLAIGKGLKWVQVGVGPRLLAGSQPFPPWSMDKRGHSSASPPALFPWQLLGPRKKEARAPVVTTAAMKEIGDLPLSASESSFLIRLANTPRLRGE